MKIKNLSCSEVVIEAFSERGIKNGKR
jgi:hypothetical protein